MKTYVLAACAAVLPLAATAAPVTLSYTGEVSSINEADNDPLPSYGPYALGDSVAGAIMLDVAGGVASVTSFSLTVDGNLFTAGSATADVRDNVAAGSSAPERDTFRVTGTSITGPSVFGTDAPVVMQFAIGGTDTSILSDEMFPTAAQLFSLFAADTVGGDLNYISFDDASATGYPDVRFTLDSLLVNGEASAPAVPLPAGLPLILAGVGSFALLRRRAKV